MTMLTLNPALNNGGVIFQRQAMSDNIQTRLQNNRQGFLYNMGFQNTQQPASAYQSYFSNLQNQVNQPSIAASDIRNQGLASQRALQQSGLQGGALARAKMEVGKQIAGQAGKAEQQQKQQAYTQLGQAGTSAISNAYQQALQQEAIRQGAKMQIAAAPQQGLLTSLFSGLV